MNEHIQHFLFAISIERGNARYSVMATSQAKAQEEVSRFFAFDPSFKINKVKAFKTYMGK
ncbi:hypothetical protein D9K81_14785 [Acinetobacter chengduensis]|uniref:Uncharacterized protein n=1 Tax=Acinetobacter chengduensis TaxID=2420890 RepID=A0ABX9TTE2_9GAMM|nr:hypothetical protein D9K81_14785 [Acinetobacter chengduensis]